MTSAHFYIDANSVVQALDLYHIAYGCLYHGNAISVQLELCGKSGALSEPVMRNAAKVVKWVSQQYGIPLQKLSSAQVRSAYYSDNPSGLCGHLDVTQAFPEDGGTHTDPGTFNWDAFIGYAKGGNTVSDTDVKVATLFDAVFHGGSSCGPVTPNQDWNIPDSAYGNDVFSQLKSIRRMLGELQASIQNLANAVFVGGSSCGVATDGTPLNGGHGNGIFDQLAEIREHTITQATLSEEQLAEIIAGVISGLEDQMPGDEITDKLASALQCAAKQLGA
jgi:hypothetical protein